VRRLTLALLFLASAGAATFLLYSRTLGYGFDYDDYHFIRPYSHEDVVAPFHGPWDASGIELPYYRPLTIAFFAARFELLGVNSSAHHALSLLLFSFVATLIAWLAYRLAGRAAAGFVALLLTVVHPAMPYALVAWVTNQMHLLEAILVLLACCWWDAVRRRGVAWWIPLLPLAIAAFLVKEDGIMLLPCVVALHLVRRQLVERDLPRVPSTFIALAFVVIAGLLFIRSEALTGLTSRPVPSAARALHNYATGLYRVFCLAPADRPWQVAASWYVMGAPFTALILWRRTGAGARALLASGACMALLFDLPFVFVTKAEQLHLVALGAVIVLAASVIAILDAAGSRAARAAVFALATAGGAALAAVTLDVTRDFEPFGPIVLAHDDIVRGWAAVPSEVRDYLARKREPAAASRLPPNPARGLERITFGTYGKERAPDGVVYEWMSGRRTEILLAPAVQTVTIPLRHAIEVFRETAHATVEANGRLIDEIDLTTPDWRISRSAIPAAAVNRLGGMHRIVITIDRAWRPAEVIRGSADGRLLGLQVGEIVTRGGVRR
jgi:hypothetical protein